MSFQGGVKEAAKMLMALEGEARERLLEDIRKKDPQMAERIIQNLITIEDVQYLSESMLVSLLRDIDLEVFGLALRSVDKSISSKILAMVSTGIRLDIEDGLNGGPRSMDKVQEAKNKVVELMNKKIELGQIVINPNGDKLV